ncbi:WD40 repeat-like protein [Armillaria luteobubalina]|uniref:WD40 repeat-like protein n=1 Tax=Armillaria luteobubalina TaxID=153913 RepID=A0AA39UR81_9AGAR|nr:WD40 repeat-like protein [Armillaria luteobubalina]
MRFRTLEIRWHDSKPISTCDFQPIPSFKKARPTGNNSGELNLEWAEKWAEQKYRLATGGEDNHVRVWMVYPSLRPTDPSFPLASPTAAPRPPRVEYLATLSRHSAAVNVVRWSPNGELIASAGDDGMIIIWSPSTTPQASTYGSDLSAEELQNEKEYWRVRCMFRCTAMQVYDLAWSPTGEYIIAGSTDNAARVFQSNDGKCVHEIAEHNHYVQGVSWDPLNEYIATQSSDHSMHVYRINTSRNHFEVHAVGRNREMSLSGARRHGRTSSVVSEDGRGRQATRPHITRRESTTSDAESALDEKEGPALWSTSAPTPVIPPTATPIMASKELAPLTPATSVASTPLFPTMFPPPGPASEKGMPQPSSRRSSFSGSNAPSSPAFSMSSRFGGRSPSPMPPLPAIRTATPMPWLHAVGEGNIGLYGDESYTNFFRRLTFSPDGGLLLTPAGQFEDPEVVVQDDDTTKRGRKAKTTDSTEDSSGNAEADKNSCVYIYTRANFARPPVAQLPGHKKASVGVRFSPVLFELRKGVSGAGGETGPKTAILEKGKNAEGSMEVNIVGELATSASETQSVPFQQKIAAPAPMLPSSSAASMFNLVTSPAISPLDATALRPPTPAASKPGTPIHVGAVGSGNSVASASNSVFALPYRMLFAVVTMDTVAIYDTQQAGPVCLLTKLHYDEFTDASWSPDGQSLILSSRDGYCTLIVFDEILPAYPTQQQTLQLQSIAHQHSVPLDITSSPSHRRSASTSSRAGTPIATPVFGSVPLPFASSNNTPMATKGEPLTPAASVDGGDASVLTVGDFVFPAKREREATTGPESAAEDQTPEPPKKKRRVVLTRVGDVGS